MSNMEKFSLGVKTDIILSKKASWDVRIASFRLIMKGITAEEIKLLTGSIFLFIPLTNFLKGVDSDEAVKTCIESCEKSDRVDINILVILWEAVCQLRAEQVLDEAV